MYTVIFRYFLVCFFFSSSVFAGDIKIGFINFVGLINVAPQAVESRKKLEKEFSKRDRSIVSKHKSIESAAAKYKKRIIIMSPSQRSKEEGRIMKMQTDLEKLKTQFSIDLEVRKKEELAKIQSVILKAMNNVAEAEGYDLIVSEGVAFASKRIDISQKVLVQLKKLYGK